MRDSDWLIPDKERASRAPMAIAVYLALVVCFKDHGLTFDAWILRPWVIPKIYRYTHLCVSVVLQSSRNDTMVFASSAIAITAIYSYYSTRGSDYHQYNEVGSTLPRPKVSSTTRFSSGFHLSANIRSLAHIPPAAIMCSSLEEPKPISPMEPYSGFQ